MFSSKPHDERLAALLDQSPPRDWFEDPIVVAHFRRIFEMDIAAKRSFKEWRKKLPLLMYSIAASSSGFRMANELRRFCLEYFDRVGCYGPYGLPSSFNVLEAFVEFDPSMLVFVLRSDRDHLLRFSQYLDWYTASSFPEEPRSLVDIMEEDLIYSYDFVLGSNEPLLAAENAKLLLAGLSFIRHGDEVAMLMLAGESPPLPADMVSGAHFTPIRGGEPIGPAESWTEDARLLEGMPDYSRILLACRFDLSSRLNDVRYVLRDIGNAYQVISDDVDMQRFSHKEAGSTKNYSELLRNFKNPLQRYADLFSAAAASLFLPAFFIDQAHRVLKTEFLTTMGTQQKEPKVRRLRRELGASYFRPRSLTYCLLDAPSEAVEYSIQPPEMKFHSTGYWKALNPGELGSSADGTPTVGKTWVHRTETWESSAPASFLAKRAAASVPADMGEFIYVMRSPSHSADIYKIGLTTRAVASRANELSGLTSTPLPFEILASWPVRDARQTEKEIHRFLAPYRLSPRREFFRAPLPVLVRIIDSVVSKEA